MYVLHKGAWPNRAIDGVTACHPAQKSHRIKCTVISKLLKAWTNMQVLRELGYSGCGLPSRASCSITASQNNIKYHLLYFCVHWSLFKQYRIAGSFTLRKISASSPLNLQIFCPMHGLAFNTL